MKTEKRRTVELKSRREPSIATKPAANASQRFTHRRIFGRFTMSAKTPAGSVKRNSGRDAAVDIIERERGEELSVFITHTAAVSCAATQVPEIKLASHSLRKTGFRNAAKVDIL